jgi:mRNA interferase MazF
MRAGHSARSVLQDGRFDATESITVCAVTTDPAEAPLFRVPTAPNQLNGLDARRFDA